MSRVAQKFGFSRKYVSLATAKDWFGLYDDGERVLFRPIVVWAISEDSDGGSGTVGLVVDEAYPELCEAADFDHFEGYISRAEIAERLEQFDREISLPANIQNVN